MSYAYLFSQLFAGFGHCYKFLQTDGLTFFYSNVKFMAYFSIANLSDPEAKNDPLNTMLQPLGFTGVMFLWPTL